MITRYEHGTTTWVDMLSPTTEEIREVMETYDIDPELVGDLSGPVVRSTAVTRGDTIKITLDFPVVKYADIEHQHEIKFLIKNDVLITVRYADIVSIHKFAKEFEVAATLNKHASGETGGHIFVTLLQALYDSFNAKLDYVGSKLETIEEEIFNEREKEMVLEISKMSRRLIVFRQVLHTHREALGEAVTLLREHFGDSLKPGITAIEERFYYLNRRVGALTESLEELRHTNNSLLTTKQNEIVKILTILAFITFPLTLVSSLFGMNTTGTPLIGEPYDFWLIVGVMIFAAFIFLLIFKYKRWM